MKEKNDGARIPLKPEFDRDTEARFRRETDAAESRFLPGDVYHLKRTLTGAGYDLPERVGDPAGLQRYFPMGEPYLFPGFRSNVNNLLL